ncbi:RICIN domain-containing protein [Amycolatopsis sp. NPDC048633]|uniref:RICIN domain-containing protein n=1 Tax=Amycolatopsis sp. NPDC048633 TaxID=3157095 RepID=UPI0033D9C2F1
MPGDWPDPAEATDPAAFVAAMRRLRVVTDLSYRTLERRAARAGASLPSSTISGALSRDTLPRADLLAAFVRACGGDEPSVERWSAARAALAAREERAEPEPPPPAEPRAKRRPVVPVAAAAAVVVALVIGGLIVFDRGGDDPAAAPGSTPVVTPPAPAPVSATIRSSSPVPAGQLRVRLAHTGFCLGEGPERFVRQARDVVGQQPCDKAFPPITAEPSEGAYRLVLRHPDKGDGCVTVDDGGTTIEVLLAGDDCADGRPDQLFTFEPVATGYRMRSVAGAKWCIGVFQGSTEPGVQLIQDPCDGGGHQVFLIDAAPAPGTER